jgi:hypothetical protein
MNMSAFRPFLSLGVGVEDNKKGQEDGLESAVSAEHSLHAQHSPGRRESSPFGLTGAQALTRASVFRTVSQATINHILARCGS